MDLLEAGTKTAAFDTLLRTKFPQMMNAYFEKVVYGFIEDHPETDVHKYYDRISALSVDSEEYRAISKNVLQYAGNVIYEIIKSLHPKEYISIKLYPKSENEKNPEWGGYWNPNSFELGAMIDDEKLRSSIVDGFYGAITGEISDQLLQNLFSTLVHEYAHFLQTISGKYKAKVDRGITPSGGDRRNITDTEDGYFAYMGALHEIDSFASEIAAEIINGGRHSLFGISKELVKDLKRDLAMGYSASRRQQDISTYLDGIIAKQDVSSKYATLVKQRLLKLVVSKLDDYVAKNPMLDRYPAIWRSFTRRGAKVALDRITGMVDHIEYDDLDGHSYKVADFLLDSGLVPENKFDEVRDIAYRLMVAKKRKYDAWINS